MSFAVITLLGAISTGLMHKGGMKKKKTILGFKRERLIMTDLTRCKVSLRGYKHTHTTHSWLPFPQHLHADHPVCMPGSLLPPQSQTCSQIKPPATSCSRPLKQMALHKLTRKPRRNHCAALLLSAEYPGPHCRLFLLSENIYTHLFFSSPHPYLTSSSVAHTNRRPGLISHCAPRRLSYQY